MATARKPVCNRCGQEDPLAGALLVACPKCKAPVGARCGGYRPSGHKAVFGAAPCVQREQAALDAGLMQKCPGKPQTPEQEAALAALEKEEP